MEEEGSNQELSLDVLNQMVSGTFEVEEDEDSDIFNNISDYSEI